MNKTVLTLGTIIATASFGVSAFALSPLGLSSNFTDKPALSAITVSADNAEGAKAFIDGMAKQGIDFLANPDLTLEQRKSEFKTLLQGKFDIRAIGRFSMGRYWSTATEAEKKEFQSLFEVMIIEVYARRFGDYKGEEFAVTSARPEGNADAIVNSHIVGNNGQKITIDWRVRHKDGQYKVIDVIVEGVSMATTQRSEFSSIIQRGGGKIQVLLDHLRG